MKLVIPFILPVQIAALSVFGLSACSSSSKPTGTRAALVQSGEGPDSSEENEEDTGDPDAPSGPQDAKPGDGTNEPGGPAGAATEGLKLFEANVHPMIVQWCKACHAKGGQPPMLADASVQATYQEINTKHLADFQDPAKSRLYLRIAKENHNCPPNPGCEPAAKSLLEKLDEWAKAERAAAASLPSPFDPAKTTGAKTLAEKTSSRKDTGIPSGSLYFPAEMAMVKAPFMVKDRSDAEGGKTITTAAGAVDQLNLNTATNDATLGTLIFNVDIPTAGTYHVLGRVLSPNQNANASSSFYVRFDTNPLQVWDYPGTNNVLMYDKADAVAGVGAPLAFTLMAGAHTLEIRQRQAGVELDSIIVTSNLTYDFSTFAPINRTFDRMEFDFSTQSGIMGAKLAMDIAEYDMKSYIIRNPEVVLPQGSGSITVKGLKVLINDRFLPQHATYVSVQETVAPPGKILSQASLIALKDKGNASDKFSLTFEAIEKVP